MKSKEENLKHEENLEAVKCKKAIFDNLLSVVERARKSDYPLATDPSEELVSQIATEYESIIYRENNL